MHCSNIGIVLVDNWDNQATDSWHTLVLTDFRIFSIFFSVLGNVLAAIDSCACSLLHNGLKN